MANSFRLDRINRVDQFVMAYGGLRGAIAFSLVSLVNQRTVEVKETMICACIVVILFTSFVQVSSLLLYFKSLKNFFVLFCTVFLENVRNL